MWAGRRVEVNEDSPKRLRARLLSLACRDLGRGAAALYNSMTRSSLPLRHAPAELIDVVVCLGKEGLSGLPHLSDDRIGPHFNRSF